jgi:hypothetical protein
MINKMVDLETWGKRAGCAIRSIGAVSFDPYGKAGQFGAEFYVNIDRQSCEDVGLVVDKSTEEWWAKQGVAAQAALIPDQRPVKEAVAEFREWFVKQKGIFIWSQGAGFDEPILRAVMEACGVSDKQMPWKFWDVRDTRTAYDICGFSPFSVKRVGTAHHALHDARHQVICVQRAHANLKRGT